MVSEYLINQMEKNNGIIDVSNGMEMLMGISRERLEQGIEELMSEGYHKYYITVKRIRTISYELLAMPDVTKEEAYGRLMRKFA